VIIIAIFVVVH